MKRIIACALLMGIMCSFSGCRYAYNRGWNDLSPWERDELQRELEDMRAEMQTEFEEMRDEFYEMGEEFRNLGDEMRDLFY